MTTPMPVVTATRTSVPATAATRVAVPCPSAPVSPATTWVVRPPMTAAIVRTLWLARMPYHGWDSSSRRSMDDRNATQAPAVGPPRIIAAPTNGRWKVIVDPPWARRTRSEPSRPNTSHRRRPPVGPESTVPGGKPGSMAGSGAETNEVHASRPRPRTIEAPV